MVECHQTLCLDIEAVEVLGGSRELLTLVLLTDECLDEADAGDILLHTEVQLVVFLEDLPEEPCHPGDDLV